MTQEIDTEEEATESSEIFINERFSIQRYSHGWQLNEYKDGKSRKGEPIITKVVTWHPHDVKYALRRIMQRCPADVNTIDGYLAYISKVSAEIDAAARRINENRTI